MDFNALAQGKASPDIVGGHKSLSKGQQIGAMTINAEVRPAQ
jgi:acetylornithine/succinyldiaminopimelate/putrescine aminotransferase